VKTQRFSAVKPFFIAELRKEDAKNRRVIKYQVRKRIVILFLTRNDAGSVVLILADHFFGTGILAESPSICLGQHFIELPHFIGLPHFIVLSCGIHAGFPQHIP
ncbi:MAG: hypothetical protein WCQ90_15925, partial [Deltaproteobacteria bacterium]